MEEVTNAAQDNTAAVEGTETQSTDTQTSTVQTAAETTEVKTEETKAETIQGTPEQYADFAVPEGFNVPMDDFTPFAKEQGWSQDKAQAVVDFYTQKIAPQIQAQQEAQITKWTEESTTTQIQAQQEAQSAKWTEESTTKYGKDGIDAANKVLSRFSSPEFNQFLKDTGLGNHPAMVGVFKAINEHFSESDLIDGKSSEHKVKTLGELFYPNMKK